MEANLNYVMVNKSWYVPSQILALHRWTLSFPLVATTLNHLLVRVTLSFLPLTFTARMLLALLLLLLILANVRVLIKLVMTDIRQSVG